VIAVFDIFRIDGGQPVWQERAQTLDDAIARVQQLGASLPGEYFIRSQKTGVEVSLTVQRSANEGARFSTRSQPLAVRYRPAQMSQPDN